MRKVFIYRVENDKGEGPYRKWVMKQLPPQICNTLDNHSSGNGRPVPILDTIGRWPTKLEICGFVTKEQAYRWFGVTLLKCLSKHGFELKKVEVKYITAQSDLQCFAVRKD